ncbi:MAG: ATP-binding protein, partial [Planctomycetota bacterium]|nr:ATP-binding protein [Planctomycetota bacterium]
AHDVAQSLLGVDHNVVGRRLATRWELPQSIIECIWLHDQDPEALPPSVAAGGHVQIVQLASALVRGLRIGNWLPRAERSAQNLSVQDLAGRMGLDSQALDEIGEWVRDEVEHRARMLGLDDRGRGERLSRTVSHEADSLTRANSTLAEQNRLLARKAGYFNGLSFLGRSITPGDSVIGACGAAAEALRQAMSVHSVVVFAIGTGRAWHEVGVSDGTVRTEFVKPPTRDSDLLRETRFAADLARTGTWLSPPGPHVSRFMERFRHLLGAGPTWLMPLVRGGRCAGGAVMQADAGCVAAWHAESAEMEGLSAACGLAIAQARSASAAIGSGEALADMNRRQAAVHAETWRAKALESVAQMAAGAAHEMNTALSVISGRAQMLRGQAAEADAKAVDAIVENADICSNVLTNLMEFATPRSPRPEAIDLLELLESLIARLVFEGMSEASDITIAISSDTPRARFDREQLIGTFRELIANAVSATEPATRRLTVKAGGELTDKNVAVAVIDNGTGMPAEVAERALDPFFSHRPAGRGRGLGLARVQQWMSLNGGRVWIDSTPGRGTRVELRLPCATRGSSERAGD